jgi:tetratricopeptide (TPR) repeat protein
MSNSESETTAITQRVRELFDSALDLPPQQRGAYLDEACGSDAVLREKLDALLARDRDDGFLEGPREAFAAMPERIGQFKILSKIGEGGMGTVYEAEQDSPRRIVALKVIRAGFASPAKLRRFALESQVVGRLQHPGIAQVYQAGTANTDSGEQPYFAMEFVRGLDLRNYVRHKQLGTRELLDLLARVCDAVHHAHHNGVIHRDLKPGNIMVDQAAQPKVLDFGVARATDSDMQITTMQTDVGQIIGTLQYMSPEQVAADPNELDSRSDVYALGVIAYELLTGYVPYNLKNKMIHEAARIIKEDEPTTLSSVNRIFGGDIETIVAKAMEKAKHRRYQSAADLAEDIRRFLRDDPILARPQTAMYQIQKFAKRHKAVVVGVVSVFVVLVCGLAGTGYGLMTATEQRNLAKEAQLAAENEAAKANAINDFLLQDMLAAPDPWADGRDVKVVDILDRAAKAVGDAFADQPEIESAARLTLGNTFKKLGLYDASQPHLKGAYTIRREHFGEDHPDTLVALHNLGTLQIAKDEFDVAGKTLADVVAKRRRILGDEQVDTIDSIVELAIARYRHGAFDKAEQLQRTALAGRRRIFGSEHVGTLNCMGALAWTLMRTGELAEAEKLFQESRDGLKRILGDNHADSIQATNGLATIYFELWKPQEAERLYQEAIEAGRRTFGRDHPASVVALNGLANVFKRTGRQSKGEPLYREVLAVYRKRLGDDHQFTLIAVNNLAVLLSRLKKFEEAEVLHRLNLTTRRRVLGDEHPDVAESLEALAIHHSAKGEYDEAVSPYLEALRIYRTRFGNAHQDVANVLANLASNAEKRGDYAEAESYYREVIRLELDLFGPSHHWVLNDTTELINVLLAKGDPASAETTARELLALRLKSLPPDDWTILDNRSLLGVCLADQKRFEEARVLLEEAATKLQEHPKASDETKRRALERIVRLYEDWDEEEPDTGKSGMVTEWRAKLGKKDEPVPEEP